MFSIIIINNEHACLRSFISPTKNRAKKLPSCELADGIDGEIFL